MGLCTNLWGPEPAGGAGPAYSVMVVAPSKLTLLSCIGGLLLGAMSDGREKGTHW